MRVKCEVVGATLNLRGPIYHVGERLWLDDTDPQHREVLARGWARPVVKETSMPTKEMLAPVDRMVRQPEAVTKQTIKSKPEPKPGWKRSNEAA